MAITSLILSSLFVFQTPVELRQVIKPNQRFEYSVQMKLSAVGAEGTLDTTMFMAERATSVTPQKVVWSHFVSDVQSKATGAFESAASTFDEMKGLKFVSEKDSLGNMLKMTVGEVKVSNPTTSDPVFGKKAVVPGDTWLADFDMNGTPLKVTYRYDGEGTEEGRPIFKVSRTVNPGQAAVDLDPTVFVFLKEDGKVLHSLGKLKVTKDQSTVQIEFNIQRIEAKK